jgi:hypothetical protein
MAIDNILIGTLPNDQTGDTLRVGATKINSNFNELDTRTSTTVSGSDQVSGSFVNIDGDIVNGDLIISGGLEVSGSTTLSGSLDVTEGINTIDYITFNVMPTSSNEVQGTMSWNVDDLTLDLIQNGTVLQLGQETQYNVTNNSGQTIANGMAVMSIGTPGASGNILAGPMSGSVPSNAKYFLGIATEQILNGDNGKVTTFGKVRGIDTSDWNNGDILWVSASDNGELTNIEPSEPDMAMPVAFVINAVPNGTILVRVNNLNQHEFARASENSTIFADLTISGSLILQNPAVPTSISGSGTQGEIRTDLDYIYVCIATNSWQRSPLSTW